MQHLAEVETVGDWLSCLGGDPLHRVLATGLAFSVEDLVERLLTWGVTVPHHVRADLLQWAWSQDDLSVLADNRILSVPAVVDGWTFTTRPPGPAGLLQGPDLLLLRRRFVGWHRIPVTFDETRGMIEVVRGGSVGWVLPAGLIPPFPEGLLGMTVCPEGVRLGVVDARLVHRRMASATVESMGTIKVGSRVSETMAAEMRYVDALLEMLADDRSPRPRPLAPLGEVLPAGGGGIGSNALP